MTYFFAWEQRKLKEVSKINPKSVLPDKFEYVDLESVVGTDMVSHRTEIKDDAPSRAQRVAQRGDVFYQTVRPYQKNNYLYDLPFDNYVFSTGYAQIRPYIDSYFLLNHLQEEIFVKTVLDHSTGTSYPAINSNDLAEIMIRIPVKTKEQAQIGLFFKNLDNTIALHQRKLDKLIQLKQGYLQQLFPQNDEKVPRVRFTNFNDEWPQCKLGKLGDTFTGLSGKTKEDFGHGEAKFVTYVNVFGNPISDPNGTERVEIDNKQNQVMFGDVFFTTSSETPEEVGMSSIWLENTKNVYLNSFCFGYHPTAELDPYYLAFMLRSPVIRKQFMFLAQGISRYNISKTKVMEMEVPVPNIDEQQKVGLFFKQLDDIITVHQSKIGKLKLLKQSLLQKMFI